MQTPFWWWVDLTKVLQYYGIATTAIFFYEYFAMLPDEVRARFSGALRGCKAVPRL